MAVLMRANFQSRILEEIFREKNISYNLIGGMKFYDRKEVKDLLSYLQVLNNPSDEVALSRMVVSPKRGVGEETIFKLSDYAGKNKVSIYEALNSFENIPSISKNRSFNLSELRNFINTHIDMLKNNSVSNTAESMFTPYVNSLKKEFTGQQKKLDTKLSNVNEFLNSIARFEQENPNQKLSHFLDKISLIQDSDKIDNSDQLKIMTIHSSKGLEFDNVFLCGFEEGIMPHQKSIDDGNIEEERRLCYVAVTRAKSKLYITQAGTRKGFKETKECEPSRFLQEIPEELFAEKPLTSKKDIVQKAKDKIAALFAGIKQD